MVCDNNVMAGQAVVCDNNDVVCDNNVMAGQGCVV